MSVYDGADGFVILLRITFHSIAIQPSYVCLFPFNLILFIFIVQKTLIYLGFLAANELFVVIWALSYVFLVFAWNRYYNTRCHFYTHIQILVMHSSTHTSFNKWKHTHTTPIRMNKWGTQSFGEQWIRISFNFNILIWWAISEIASQFAKLIVLCHASHFSVLVFIIKCTCAVQWLFLGSLTKSFIFCIFAPLSSQKRFEVNEHEIPRKCYNYKK